MQPEEKKPVATITEKEPGKFVLSFNAQHLIEPSQADELRDIVDKFMEKKKPSEINQFVVDFAGVGFLSSRLLNSFILLDKTLKKEEVIKSGLQMANMHPHIYEVLAITRLNRLFDVKGTVEEHFKASAEKLIDQQDKHGKSPSEVIMDNGLAKISRVQPHTYVMEYTLKKLIDADQIDQLKKFMVQFADGPKGPGERRRLIIDGSNLEFLAAGGLNGLIILDRKLKERGDQLMLTHIKPEIGEVFAITHLDKLFDFRNTVAEALATDKGGIAVAS